MTRNMNSEQDFQRRKVCRRQGERRLNPFPFNSPEWIAWLQQHYVLWPKCDRRLNDRRATDRRASERRNSRHSPLRARSYRYVRRLSSDDILNDDEKQLIRKLFNEGN